MATDNQIEANRLNAQSCTGPKTEEGKARSSQNALKTGLYSQAEVTATESQEEFEALAADYHSHYTPANPHERSLVDALVRYEWLSRRYMAADTALWNFSLVTNKMPHGQTFLYHAENLSRAGRYFNSARKGYANTMKELEAAQSKRKAESAQSPVSTQSPGLSRDCKGAVTQFPGPSKPQSNEPLVGKLVSFRQPAASDSEAPAENTQTDQPREPDGEKVPPIAA